MSRRHRADMPLAALRSLLVRRAALRREAAGLIEVHGQDAWKTARRRAHAAMGDVEGPADRAQVEAAWHVVHLVERRLRIHRQPDTATRWLETPVRPLRPRPWSETPTGRAVLDQMPNGRDGT